MGRYIRGGIDEDITLSTLGAKSLVAQVFDDVVNERTLVTSVVVAASMRDYTNIANGGPIMIGVAHTDYTAAEIEEWIENTGSWDEGDLVNQEIAKRKIRMIGILAPGGGHVAADEVALFEGAKRKFKLNWILNAGQTLDVWAYNLGTAALTTTSAVVNLQGHANLFPK